MKDKKYILRTPHDPFEITPYADLHAHIGKNVGNLVYVAGVTRALMVTDNTTFEKTKHRFLYTDEEIDYINQTCDGFIISLADAIRANYVARMKNMTEFIRKLKIPCVIIGVGVRVAYEPEKDFGFSFDDDVRDFFSAVLDKSAIIGLRGQITADYLKHLGFKEEQHYTVIGCPSMYMFGETLPFRDTADKALSDPCSPVSFNLSPNVDTETYRLISEMASRYDNAVYLPQNSKDEILMYYGVPYENPKRPYWPTTLEHPFYTEHDALFHNNPLSWIDFQKTRDLSFGTRVHGNITAVLAGTPAVFMPQASRVRELCDYHGFANIPRKQSAGIGRLEDAIEHLDFKEPLRRQAKNFDHYRSFLRQNGLDNIFDEGITGEAPYDRKTARFHSEAPLHQISKEPASLQRKRLKEWETRNDPEKVSALSRIIKRLGISK